MCKTDFCSSHLRRPEKTTEDDGFVWGERKELTILALWCKPGADQKWWCYNASNLFSQHPKHFYKKHKTKQQQTASKQTNKRRKECLHWLQGGSPSLPNTWHIHHHCNWLAMTTNSHDRHKKTRRNKIQPKNSAIKGKFRPSAKHLINSRKKCFTMERACWRPMIVAMTSEILSSLP